MRAALLAFALLAAGACRTEPLPVAGGDAGAGVEYRAQAVPTGVARISIQKIDHDNHRCTTILIANGITGAAGFTVTLPPTWSVERAWQQATDVNCASLAAPTGAPLATAGTGTIKFDPTTLSSMALHVQLTFPTAAESLDDDALSITPAQ